MSGEFGTGKTIFVLAIVVGCFAVLWPKIFYPMLTASITQPSSGRQAWRDEANKHFLHQLCYLLEEHHLASSGASSATTTPVGGRWTGEECWQEVWTSCKVQLTESLISDVRLGKDKSNLTNCLSTRYSLTPALVNAAAPPRIRPRPYLPQGVGPHARPERPAHLYPEMMHPALREKGRAMPQRTIDKNARPGPMPGVRPPMGGAGGIVPPPQAKGSGAMGIIMPLYTVGIVIFFVYTIMKVLFKKGEDEDDKTPKLKDFGLDPEYRKYVFAEEYLDNADVSNKDQARRMAREESRNRKKAQTEVPADTKIEDEQLDQLRRRLEETEKAMERLMCQMGSVTDKLTAAKITEVLSQAQAQAKILKIGLDTVMESAAVSSTPADKKEEVGEMTSEDDLTSSEALTSTLSEDTSLPTSLQRHLEEIQVEQLSSYSELLGETGQLPLEATLPLSISVDGISTKQGILSNLDTTELQGEPALGDLISGVRTVIQLQELKDDEAASLSAVEVVNQDEVLAESTVGDEYSCIEGESMESIDNPEPQVDVVFEPPPHYEDRAPCEKQSNLFDMAQTLPATSLDKDISQEAIEKENACEDIAEAVLAPAEIPASKDATPIPIPEPIDAYVRELSSEGSSEATETGADISDFNSFAEENQGSKQALSKDIDESRPSLQQESLDIDEESESICKGQGTQTSFALSVTAPQIDSKEDSTQTEKEKEVTVLGVNTSFRHDEGGVETRGNSQGPIDSQVTEIVLDALLPSETQLLVKDSKIVGSSPTADIEIETSEAGAVPCVVTSNVSLAFLGLETREEITPSPTSNNTIVASEDVSDVQNVEPEEDILKENQEIDVAIPNPEKGSEVISCPLVSDECQEEIADFQKSISQADINPGAISIESTHVLEYVDDDVGLENPASAIEQEQIFPAKISSCDTTDIGIVATNSDLENDISKVDHKEQAQIKIEDTKEKIQPVIECTEMSEQMLNQETVSQETLNLESDDKEIYIEEAEKKITNKSSLLPEGITEDDQMEILARPSSPLPPHVLERKDSNAVQDVVDQAVEEIKQESKEKILMEYQDEIKETEIEEDELEKYTPQMPVTPSLEAIAEAVAAATTRAALEVLATTQPESQMSLEETDAMLTKSTFLTEEIPADQSPVSTDESSAATTVVAVSDAEDVEICEQAKSAMENIVNDVSPETEATYVATVTHTPSGSPSSTPEMEMSRNPVEAALAEAAREESMNKSMTKSITHEQPITQEGQTATTVSPKNEESPTSSKGSSPDMDEYEVITKDEGQTANTNKEKNTKEDATKAKGGSKIADAPTSKKHEVSQVKKGVREVEVEEEEKEEEEKEAEEAEETEEVEDLPKRCIESNRHSPGTTATKTTAKGKTKEQQEEEISEEE